MGRVPLQLAGPWAEDVSEKPLDSWSPGAFQVTPTNGWQPTDVVRTAVWLVKDVGLPVVLSGVLVAVILGWVSSPLSEIGRVKALLESHVASQEDFQRKLLDGIRNQRCLTAVTALTYNAEIVAAAALSSEPCVYLENMPRGKR